MRRLQYPIVIAQKCFERPVGMILLFENTCFAMFEYFILCVIKTTLEGGALFMTTMVIKVNPLYDGMADAGVLATGLRARIRRATSDRERVDTELPLKVQLPAGIALEVRVARKDPVEGYTPEAFALYLGAWLVDLLDGPLKDKQITVTVVFGRNTPGVWKRFP